MQSKIKFTSPPTLLSKQIQIHLKASVFTCCTHIAMSRLHSPMYFVVVVVVVQQQRTVLKIELNLKENYIVNCFFTENRNLN